MTAAPTRPRPTRPRRTRRILAFAGACGLAALSLTGCLDVNADVTVNSDAQGTGTFAISLEKQAAGIMQISSLDDFKAGITQQETGTGGGDLMNSPDCTASETADAYIYTCPFTNMAFTKDDGPWTIAKDGNEIIFTMTGSTATTPDTGESSDLLGGGSLGNLTVNVTFPGNITGVKGSAAKQTSDTSATITGTVTDKLDVIITSDASSSAPMGLIIGAIVAVIIVIVFIVLVLFLVLRGRKKATVVEPDPGAAVLAGSVVGGGAAMASGDAAASGEPVAPIVVADAGSVESPPDQATVVTEPVVAQPVAEEVVAAEPAVAEPVTEDVVTAEPVVEETVVEDAVTEADDAEQPPEQPA